MREISEQLLGKIEEAIEYFGGVSEEGRECLEAAMGLYNMFDNKEKCKTVLNSLIYPSKKIISKIIDNYDFWDLEKKQPTRVELANYKDRIGIGDDVESLSEAVYIYRLSENDELTSKDLELLAIIYKAEQEVKGNEKVGGSVIKEDLKKRMDIIKKLILAREDAEETQENLSETAGVFGSEGRKPQEKQW